MTSNNGKHAVGILALNDFVPFDYGIAWQMFSLARTARGEKAYELFFIGPGDSVFSNGFAITVIAPLSALLRMDTVIVPGIARPFEFRDEEVAESLRTAFTAGVRLASICTGACVLAASGVLDGMSATTHWEAIDELAKRYPAITVEPDVLFVDNGRVLTSAGLSSGIDLCLHMIRKDLGAKAAERLAAFFVAPVERDGGHRQRIRHHSPRTRDNLAALQVWLLENMHRPLALRDIAERAYMSPRTVHRKFQEQSGLAPMAWLTKARIRRAQALLEAGTLPQEEIAALTGFGTVASFRRHFRRIVGTSPASWQKTYVTHYKE